MDEEEHGVPFPGEIVPPERQTRNRTRIPRHGPFDWAGVFGREGAPRVVDLGCGNGRYLIASALARPTHDHLGVDLVPQAIQHAARRASERGLANVQFAWGDALDLLFQALDPRSVDEVHVYHPQPYYDRAKVGRRMLTPAFFGRVWTVLRPGGLLVLQTDNPAYWRYVRRVAPLLFDWREHQGPWPDAPEGRTRREILARAKGLCIRRGTGTPLALDPAEAERIWRRMPRPTFDANRPGFRRRKEPGGRGDSGVNAG